MSTYFEKTRVVWDEWFNTHGSFMGMSMKKREEQLNHYRDQLHEDMKGPPTILTRKPKAQIRKKLKNELREELKNLDYTNITIKHR